MNFLCPNLCFCSYSIIYTFLLIMSALYHCLVLLCILLNVHPLVLLFLDILHLFLVLLLFLTIIYSVFLDHNLSSFHFPSLHSYLYLSLWVLFYLPAVAVSSMDTGILIFILPYLYFTFSPMLWTVSAQHIIGPSIMPCFTTSLTSVFLLCNNLIYSLQFGFKQKYSTVHALIGLTENISRNLDEGNTGCGIFVDLRKHLILLNIIFFYQSLNIMVVVVLLMNVLNLIFQIESNISMIMILILWM